MLGSGAPAGTSGLVVLLTAVPGPTQGAWPVPASTPIVATTTTATAAPTGASHRALRRGPDALRRSASGCGPRMFSGWTRAAKVARSRRSLSSSSVIGVLLKCAGHRGQCAADRGANRALGETQCPGDLGDVQVGVVAQHDHLALAAGQHLHRRDDLAAGVP